MKIKKGDTVEVISGDDKGQRGTVHRVVPGQEGVRGRTPKGVRRVGADPDRGRVVVSGVNMVKKHQRRTGDVKTQVGIIEREAPVHVSDLALVCPHCQKASRVGYQVLENGDKVRVCKRCHQTIG
jgi:large subunit ribosomal protein L24